MSKNILVVDDEKDIRDSIGIYLKSEGYNIYLAEDGMKALQILENEDIHLIIMDVMMPNLDGINATMKIRESRNIPIIMVTAKSEDVDMILGLNVGADDYIRKPFNPLELVARVKAQMRRYVTLGTYEKETKDSNEIEVRGLVLNNETKEVHINGEEVKLTPMEFKILALLMENTGRVFPIEEIYERVWEEPFYNSENTVAVHIRRIREKIEINPKEPRYLKVVWGVGYKIDKWYKLYE